MINFSRLYAAPLLAVALAAVSIGALAGDGERSVQVFKFGNADRTTEVVRLDSEQMGFDVSDLGDGDSRTFTDGDGRVITLSRNAATMNIAFDGQSHDVPFGFGVHEMGGDGHDIKIIRRHVAMSDDNAMGDDIAMGNNIAMGENLEIIRKHAPMDDNTLRIVSGQALDESTRAAITQALAAAGVDKTVVFDSAERHVVVEIEANRD